MKDPSSEVDAALCSRQPIARESFIRWIESASDLATLAKLHYLIDTACDRIQPELGSKRLLRVGPAVFSGMRRSERAALRDG